MLAVVTAVILNSTLSYAGALAVRVCDSREKIVAKLSNEYHENQRAIGLLKATEMMEIFVGEGGTWTILSTNVASRSCIVASGTAFNIMTMPKKVEELSN